MSFEKYTKLKTRKEKIKFSSNILDEKYDYIYNFNKISETTIDILVYNYYGKKFMIERKYKPKFKDN